jgi:hypothetical protein
MAESSRDQNERCAVFCLALAVFWQFTLQEFGRMNFQTSVSGARRVLAAARTQNR